MTLTILASLQLNSFRAALWTFKICRIRGYQKNLDKRVQVLKTNPIFPAKSLPKAYLTRVVSSLLKEIRVTLIHHRLRLPRILIRHSPILQLQPIISLSITHRINRNSIIQSFQVIKYLLVQTWKQRQIKHLKMLRQRRLTFTLLSRYRSHRGHSK